MPEARQSDRSDREGRFGVAFAHADSTGIDTFSPTINLKQVLELRGAASHAVKPDELHRLTATRATDILINVAAHLDRHAGDLMAGDWSIESRIRRLEVRPE